MTVSEQEAAEFSTMTTAVGPVREAPLSALLYFSDLPHPIRKHVGPARRGGSGAKVLSARRAAGWLRAPLAQYSQRFLGPTPVLRLPRTVNVIALPVRFRAILDLCKGGPFQHSRLHLPTITHEDSQDRSSPR